MENVGTVRAPVVALVVGAISRDLEQSADASSEGRPGGVVVHGALALVRLGAHTRVVTRAHPGDTTLLVAPLREAGVEVLALPSRQTTTYRNDYSGAVDRHDLLAVSDPIRPGDVPDDWRAADITQLGPLHPDDLMPETVAAARGLRGLDVQGLVRVRSPAGTHLRPCPDLPRFLAHVDVMQASEQELPAVLVGETLERFAARHGVRELIVTRGARGATVVVGGRATEVPPAGGDGRGRVGAGDVFLATYLLFRVRGHGPGEAARGAAHASALHAQGGTGAAPGG